MFLFSLVRHPCYVLFHLRCLNPDLVDWLIDWLIERKVFILVLNKLLFTSLLPTTFAFSLSFPQLLQVRLSSRSITFNQGWSEIIYRSDAFLISQSAPTTSIWTRNLSSHTDMQTHTSSTLHDSTTFDLLTSESMHAKLCRTVYVDCVSSLVLITQIVLLLQHGHTHTDTKNHICHSLPSHTPPTRCQA